MVTDQFSTYFLAVGFHSTFYVYYCSTFLEHPAALLKSRIPSRTLLELHCQLLLFYAYSPLVHSRETHRTLSVQFPNLLYSTGEYPRLANHTLDHAAK